MGVSSILNNHSSFHIYTRKLHKKLYTHNNNVKNSYEVMDYLLGYFTQLAVKYEAPEEYQRKYGERCKRGLLGDLNVLDIYIFKKDFPNYLNYKVITKHNLGEILRINSRKHYSHIKLINRKQKKN
ncbi:Plasmodium RESA N-terminal, putative [Plasmodium ovale]|uniref:Plasmodium RESA N-terminal, putative n=1 Tax=Plasmodium ovale TaxID=36330 RepID=A0A1C3KIU6_PLAOA|nr:Plasmodium RESA N-terminal, putative [Plasmodium ovale]